MSWRRRWPVAVSLAALVVAGCARSRPTADASVPRDAPARPPSVAAAGPPADLDLGAVFERTRLAFHADEAGAFRGGGDAFGAEVDGATVLVRAAHRPRPEDDLVASAPLTLGPAYLAGAALDVEPATLRSAVDGSLSIQHAGFVEHLENRPSGLEQSFVFDVRPEGRLVVRVPARGMSLALADEAGLHFRDAGSGLGLVYGHGTFRDARGLETDVPATFRGGEIVLEVPGDVLDASAWPAVLDPLVGPEIRIGVPSAVAAAGMETAPRVSAASPAGAIVWLDGRHGFTRAYGTTLSGTGGTIDRSLGLELSAVTTISVDVASGAGTNLVVYTSATSIRAVPLSPGGVIGAPTTLSSVAAGGAIASARVAFDGTAFVVVWSERSGTDLDVRVARLDATAAVLDAPSTLVAAPLDQTSPAIGCGAVGCAVAYTSGAVVDGDVYLVRLGPALAPLDAPALPLDVSTGSQSAPALVAVSDGWVVAWEDDASGRIRARRVAPDGTLGAAATAATGTLDRPALVTFSDRVWISWTSGTTSIRMDELNHAGAPIGTGYTPTASTATGVGTSALAWNGTRMLVVWSETGTGSMSDVRLMRMSTTGTTLDALGGVLVSGAGLTHSGARAAWGGSTWLVVWSQTGATTLRDIYGVRINPDGSLAESVGFAISNTTEDEMPPRVASTGVGSGWLVAYEVTRRVGSTFEGDVIARSVSNAGTPGIRDYLDRPYAYRPVVVASSDRYLVMWGPTPEFIRLTASSSRLDTSSRSLGTTTTSADDLTMASNGTSFGVAWTETRAGEGYAIRTASITSAGTVTPTGGAATLPGERAYDGLRIAYGMSTWMVTWGGVLSVGSELLGARISAPGGTLSGARFRLDGAESYDRSLVWDGAQFVAFYESATAGLGTRSIRAARTLPDGTILDATPPTVVSSADSITLGAAAADTTGHVLLAYNTFDVAAGTTRTLARIVDMRAAGTTPIGAACTSGWPCATGFCVDGVCCNTACVGCGVCSVARGAGTDGTCAPLPAATTCRAAAGTCDVAELCDGVATTCPRDMLRPISTSCAASTGPCDRGAVCNGVSAVCPPPVPEPSGTSCRPAAGDCDRAEVCDGTSPACPADARVARRTVCRPAIGGCDAQEECDGSSSFCPPDLIRATGAICREASGPCDDLERCNGTTTGCPPDLRLARGTECGVADGECGVVPTCDGVLVSCPPSVVAAVGTVCRASRGPCDSVETCNGEDRTCPTDRTAPNGTPCDTDTLWCNGVMSCSAGTCVLDRPSPCSRPDAVCAEEGHVCTAPDLTFYGRRPDGCGCHARSPSSPRGVLVLVAGLVALLLRRRARGWR